MAAAIGASLPIHEPLGNMVVDVGGGTTEVAVISLGGVVALEAVRVGSFDIDSAIQAYVRREYGMAIGERTAEEIKLAIASAYPGRGRVEGRGARPRPHDRAPEDDHARARRGARRDRGAGARDLRRGDRVPRATPPELAQDLIANGVHLVGGGGMLKGLDRRIEQETDLPVHLVDAPLECVVLGAGRCLESFDSLKEMFMARSTRGRRRRSRLRTDRLAT